MVAQAAMGALCGPYQDLNPVEYLAAKKQAKDSSNAWTQSRDTYIRVDSVPRGNGELGKKINRWRA